MVILKLLLNNFAQVITNYVGMLSRLQSYLFLAFPDFQTNFIFNYCLCFWNLLVISEILWVTNENWCGSNFIQITLQLLFLTKTLLIIEPRCFQKLIMKLWEQVFGGLTSSWCWSLNEDRLVSQYNHAIHLSKFLAKGKGITDKEKVWENCYNVSRHHIQEWKYREKNCRKDFPHFKIANFKTSWEAYWPIVQSAYWPFDILAIRPVGLLARWMSPPLSY